MKFESLHHSWTTLASRCVACLQIAALLLVGLHPAAHEAASEIADGIADGITSGITSGIAAALAPSVAHAQEDADEEFEEEKPPETSFITFNYGADFNPRQIHIQFVDVTLDDRRMEMISLPARDRRLRESFPETQAPLTAKLEYALDTGIDAYYFDANYGRTRQTIEAALDEIDKNLLAITLFPDLAHKAWEAGLLLVMSIPEDTEDAQRDRVLAHIVRLFPFVEPKVQDFPPHLVDMYRDVFKPSASNAFLLKVVVKDGCWIRVNGFDRARNASSDELFVLAGKYAIAQICPDKENVGQVSRVFVVHVNRDETIDFTGEFALAFDFPNDFNLNASLFPEDEARQVALVTTLGHRLQVDQMISAGLLPSKDQEESMYKIMLIDVENDRLIRERTVPLTQIATPERMRDALHSLLTGEEFEIILPPPPPTTDWTFVGIITTSAGAGIMAVGVVFAILADVKNEEFQDCSADPVCRTDVTTRNQQIKDRDQNALVANILLVAGGVVMVAGLTMILVHQLSNRGTEKDKSDSEEDPEETLEEEYESMRDWTIGFAPTDGGGYFGFGLTF